MRGLAAKGRTALATQREIATFPYLVSRPQDLCVILVSLSSSLIMLCLSSMVLALMRRNEVIIRKMRVPYR